MARYNRKDHLHQRAKKDGLRSRAAYKLEEVQKQFKLLSKGQRVVDLGCWPGGWLEVAAGLVGPSGRVVGVDRAEVDPPIPLANVGALVGDLEDSDIASRLLTALAGNDTRDAAPGDASAATSARVEGDEPEPAEDEGAPVRLADVVLSDAAPKLTGVRETDRANEERLLEAIEALLPRLLAPGGSLLIKILEGPEAQAVDKRMRERFAKAKTIKLQSTRKGSTERYLVARGWKGA
jgi:23S rRNA (uridine2552-2'-O)-methyltransferase